MEHPSGGRPELSFLISNLTLPSPSPSYAFTPIVLSRLLHLQLVSSNPREGPPVGVGDPGYPLPSFLADQGEDKGQSQRCFTDVADCKQNHSSGAFPEAPGSIA